MLKGKTVGIRDVALLAQVSVATVSRALNNPEVVRPEVRSRVAAAVAELGYIPDASARALASGRTRTIGAIVPAIDNPTFARGIDALQRYLSGQDYLLLLATSGYDPKVELRQAQNMISRGIDGLILIGDVHSDALRRMLAAQQIACINASVYHPDKPYASVGADNQKAGYRACRHLIDLGHRDIGMVSGLTAHNDRAAARVSGVRRALQEVHAELRAECLIEIPSRLDDARQAARTLLALQVPPTAIIGINDLVAYGVLMEAERSGLRVPTDLSVLGFDDLEWSRHLRPSLTTMHFPSDEVWTRAGQYIVHTLDGMPTTQHHEVDVSLVVRESTGPANRDERAAVEPVKTPRAAD